MRVITLSGLTLAGAVLDRSGVAALLRTEILCCSAALLGMLIADVTLRPVHHRHLFRRLSSAFRFRPLRRAYRPRSASDVLGFLALRFPAEPVSRARSEPLMPDRVAPAGNGVFALWITRISWIIAPLNRFPRAIVRWGLVRNRSSRLGDFDAKKLNPPPYPPPH